jgi:PIN domain nuclease of toxin-antitoxin system
LIHRDPFDRLLIATAKADDLTIVTADENIHKYDAPWLW